MLRRIERVHELRVLIMRQIGGSGSDGGLGVVFAMLGDTRRLVDVRDGKVAFVHYEGQRLEFGRLGIGEDAGPHGVYLESLKINTHHIDFGSVSQEWAGSCRWLESRVVCWLRNSRILQIAPDLECRSFLPLFSIFASRRC